MDLLALCRRILQLESILTEIVQQVCVMPPYEHGIRYSSHCSGMDMAFDYLVNHGLAVRAGGDIIFAPAPEQQQLNRLASCGLPKQGAGANEVSE